MRSLMCSGQDFQREGGREDWGGVVVVGYGSGESSVAPGPGLGPVGAVETGGRHHVCGSRMIPPCETLLRGKKQY